MDPITVVRAVSAVIALLIFAVVLSVVINRTVSAGGHRTAEEEQEGWGNVKAAIHDMWNIFVFLSVLGLAMFAVVKVIKWMWLV